jgi:hypothetical protein
MGDGNASRPACGRLCAAWDEIIDVFLKGGSCVPTEFKAWADSYQGRGRGEVVWNAFPEPFLGRLDRRPAGVVLALNPGVAHLDFQGRHGVFAAEIRGMGSYTAWAASWPYLRDPWRAVKGRNRHHESRLWFLRNWSRDENLDGDAIVAFELYPWHSTNVTAAIRPDPQLLRRWLWEPIGELGAPVFAFGAPWFNVLEHSLGLTPLVRLGAGGHDYGSAVPSRTVVAYRDEPTGSTVIAERHLGSAGPPNPAETDRLRDAVQRWT